MDSGEIQSLEKVLGKGGHPADVTKDFFTALHQLATTKEKGITYTGDVKRLM